MKWRAKKMTSWVLDNVRADDLIVEIKSKVMKDLHSNDRLFVEIELLR